mgnify:CR=1 FL=1
MSDGRPGESFARWHEDKAKEPGSSTFFHEMAAAMCRERDALFDRVVDLEEKLGEIEKPHGDTLALGSLRAKIDRFCKKMHVILTGQESEKMATLEQVETLGHKVRMEVTKMHRRAQRLEGIERHMERVREGHARELGRVLHRAEADSKLWYRRYVEAVDQLREAGVNDRHYGHHNHRIGSLRELIRRLVEERDLVKAELERLKGGGK